MKKLKTFLDNNVFYIAAFIIPAIILTLAYREFGMAPFGEKSVLIADMRSQYSDYFGSFHDLLNGKAQGDFFYSWSGGPGLNYLGLFLYYLASPFNLIFLLFSKSDISIAMLLILVLKTGACSASFSFFAKNKFRFRPLSCIIFGSLYALCAYAVVYTTNVMWLDVLIILPVMVLGLDRLVSGRGTILYTLSLFLIFLTNFYIAFMVCIFAVIYFFSEVLKKDSFLGFGKLFAQFLIGSLLSAAMGAIALLPAFFSIFDSYQRINSSLTLYSLGFDFWDIASKLFLKSYDSLTYGAPNIYVGIGGLFLCLLYFFNTNINLRKKLVSLAVLLFFTASFLIGSMDLIWHLFQRPTWFPYRYSFLFCFYALYLAMDCLKHKEGIKGYGVGGTTALIAVLLVFLDRQNFDHFSRQEILENFVLLFIYSGLIMFLTVKNSKFKPQQLLPVLGLMVIVCELFLNTFETVKDLDKQFGYYTHEEYSSYHKKYSDLLAHIKDGSYFYRVGIDNSRDSNDALSLGFRGLAHYSSVSNQSANIFMGRMGYYNGFADRYFHYYGGTAASESLFGIKYIISPNRRDMGLKLLDQVGEEKIFENAFALPLGFGADKKLKNLSAGNGNPFNYQNEFFSKALGENQEIFAPIEPIKGAHVPKGESVQVGKGKFDFTVQNPKSQYVYFYSNNTFPEGATVSLNGEIISKYPDFHVKGIIPLGYFEAGEAITVTVDSWYSSSRIDTVYFAGAQESELNNAIAQLKASSLILTKSPDSKISGHINVKKDGIIFLSVPADKGWRAKIDGKKADTESIGGGFISVDITKGTHTVELSFIPRGFVLGSVISGLGCACFIVYIILRRHRIKISSEPVSFLKEPKEI